MTPKGVFLMSCGSPKFRFPDEWITAQPLGERLVDDTHISRWWSGGHPQLLNIGDIGACLAGCKPGDGLGIDTPGGHFSGRFVALERGHVTLALGANEDPLDFRSTATLEAPTYEQRRFPAPTYEHRRFPVEEITR